MHPDISKLLEVQKVDAQLARIRRDLDSLPREEAKRKQRLDQIRAASEAAKHAMHSAQVKSRESENNIRSADDEIKKLESRLNVVKNNAEYQATLFQIESVRKERAALEEEGLALLDSVESLQAACREAEEKLRAEEATFVKFQEEAAKIRESRQVDLANVGQGRQQLVDGVPPDLLEKYRTLFEFRDGMAVSPVEGGHCMGCYSSITPNDMARLLGATSIVQCGSCQRMLYLADS